MIITRVVGTVQSHLEEEDLVITGDHSFIQQSPYWVPGTGPGDPLSGLYPYFPINARKPSLHTSTTWARHFPLPGALF